MIQDIGDCVFDNAYVNVEPTGQDFVLAFRKGAALMSVRGDELAFPRLADWDVPAHDLFVRYLFSIDGQRFFLAENELVKAPEGFTYEPVNQFRFLQPRGLSFAGITAYQLRNWYWANRYCGHCGSELGHVQNSREMVCPTCSTVVYPKISPAVIVGVCHGDELLLTKYAGRGYVHFALIAGFCEVGESLERTIMREVREEVGLEVCNLRYYKSQPWSFSDSLLMGFYADVQGDTAICVDHDELALGQWMRREDILRLSNVCEDTSSLTNEMMRAFARGEEPK